ncbi:unnamed protein product, partial [Discosporangium mesarthrocarpum]
MRQTPNLVHDGRRGTRRRKSISVCGCLFFLAVVVSLPHKSPALKLGQPCGVLLSWSRSRRQPSFRRGGVRRQTLSGERFTLVRCHESKTIFDVDSKAHHRKVLGKDRGTTVRSTGLLLGVTATADVGTTDRNPNEETVDSSDEDGGVEEDKNGDGGWGRRGKGEVVLSDWLGESIHGETQVVHSQGQERQDTHEIEEGGRYLKPAGSSDIQEQKGRRGSLVSVDQGSAPFRFYQLIQNTWNDLSDGDKLGYLGQEGQMRVKQALTVLAAYGALREHPVHSSVASPQQAFSEMDFDSDGEVTFQEFVRWYRGPDENQDNASPSSPQSLKGPPPPAPTPTFWETAPPASSSPADIQNHQDRRPSPGSGGSDPELPWPWPSQRGQGKGQGQGQAQGEGRGEAWPILLTPDSVAWAGDGGGRRRRALTPDEREALRERWLAGGLGKGDVVPLVAPGARGRRAGTGRGGKVPGVSGSNFGSSLGRVLDMVGILVKANADADTLVAALASCIMRQPGGGYNLEVIGEQFGPIVRGIVEDRLLLERLPCPPSSTSYVALQQSRGMRPVLDMDDHHAKLLREYLVRSSRDARAVVLHMADLLQRLRSPSDMPAHERQTLALEALQLYVPVSNALGLGSSFRELEELGYRSLFPKTYGMMAAWH